MEIENINCFHEVRFTGEDDQSTISMVPVAQEIVRQGFRRVPERFGRSTDDHSQPSIPRSTPPVIDLTKLDANRDSRDEELRRLSGAMEDWGMFFVIGHGVSRELLASLKEVIKGFFSLSFEEKRRSVGSYFSTDNLGYGRSFVKSRDQRLDWMDRYAVRVQPNQDNLGLRLWPLTPTNFRRVVEKYVAAVGKTCEQLLQCTAESLGLQEQAFREAFEPRPDCVVNVRVNYYPPWQGGDVSAAPHGISPHSDGSAITVLAQFDGRDGLEVLRPEGWVRVPAPEDGKLLVAAGDLLQVISNGRVQSPWHRAEVRRDEERYSVALFYYPPEDKEVGPVVGGVGSAGPRYRRVVVGDYLKNYYKVSPTKQKSTVDFAKIRD